MKTALNIPFIKTSCVEGNVFELFPRRGVHKELDIVASINHIRENYIKVATVNVVWLPRLPKLLPSPHDPPYLMFRTQLMTGHLSPMKKVVWGSMDFENYSIAVGLYNGVPEADNLLPQPRITFSDGKYRYAITAFLFLRTRTG